MPLRSPEQLVIDWFGMLQLCQNPPVDQKVFKKIIDAWSKEWAKLTYEQQGFCSEKIHEGLLN